MWWDRYCSLYCKYIAKCQRKNFENRSIFEAVITKKVDGGLFSTLCIMQFEWLKTYKFVRDGLLSMHTTKELQLCPPGPLPGLCPGPDREGLPSGTSRPPEFGFPQYAIVQLLIFL